MTPPDDHQDRIHRLVDQVLREQTLRRAPSTLESRVFAEIERHARMPWWRRSFGHWPLAARVGFLVASCGFVKLALAGAMWLASVVRAIRFEALLNPAVTWMHVASSLITATAKTGSLVIDAIPQPWLHGAMASGVVLYLALFGIVATAYRMLYSPR